MKLSQIYEGWKNHLIPSKHLKTFIKETAAERIKICEACGFHSKHHRTSRPDAHCTDCGCTLSAKTKCLSCNCPIGRWTQVFTQLEEEEIKSYAKES